MRATPYIAAAVVALAAGAGAAWWRLQPGAPQPAAPSGLIATLSSGQLKAPDGQAFRAGALTGRPVIVNFWATWCPPCVEEMPELDRFAKTQPGVALVGVAIDNPSNVREFLRKTAVSYPIALAGLEGTELMRDLGNTAGGLPFTLVLDRNGKVVFSKMGKTDAAELQQALSKL
ncbi:MAG: TlpA family protein disulfide reductase [Betaproteobacteria bacterium]|nr:TlpA family protein disulfide reductase [Betaproteobacteria bacterium]MDE2049209.1 TlpA family protein disulfide reductase [Betaproteobacteria bacterium]